MLRSLRSRMLVAGIVSAVTVTAAVPSGAATTSFHGKAESSGVALTLLDTVDIDAATAAVDVTSAPAILAAAAGLVGNDATVSSVSVTDGVATDPATGQRCATPTLPAPLDAIQAGAACSNVTGDATAPAAIAHSSVGTIPLDGSLLADLVDYLAGGVVNDLATALDTAVDVLESASGPLVGPVVDVLAPACQQGLDAIADASAAFDTLGDVSQADPTGVVSILTETSTRLPADAVMPTECDSLLALLTNLPSITVAASNILAALKDLLAGLDLVELELGGADAAFTTAPDEVISASSTTALSLTLPSLSGLLDQLDGIITDLATLLTDEVGSTIATEFADLIPTATSLVQPVLDALSAPDLLGSNDPLLTMSLTGSRAKATLDRATNVVSSEAIGPDLTIALSDAFAALLGEEITTFGITPGETQTFFADTPLESTIAIGGTDVVSETIDGIDLVGVRASGAHVELLTGVSNGIVGDVAVASAAVGGVETAPAPGGDMPSTGGGVALAGIALAGLGLALRRRR